MNIGKLPENVLKRSVLRQLKTRNQEVIEGAGVGTDCALLSVSGKETVYSCMQEGIVFPASDAVHLNRYAGAVTMQSLLLRLANNMAAGGGRMTAVTVGLILPRDTEEAFLRELMKDLDETSAALKVQVIGGQTRVSDAVSAPVAVLTATGTSLNEAACGLKKAAAGQDIVVSKWIGLEGTSKLARKYRDSILERYPVYLVDEAALFDRFLSVVPEAATAVKSGVSLMHDISEGGIFGALWEIAERAGVGLTVDLKKIPLRQETVEVCEHCGANPYELLSGGSLLMIAPDGQGLVNALAEENIPASIIGKVTDSKDRILRNEDEVRFLDRPAQDALYRS